MAEQFNRRISDRRASDANGELASGRRSVDNRLTEIDDMIRKENDEEKRNVLLVLHCLTSTLSSVSQILADLEKQQSALCEDTEERLGDHDRLINAGKASWKTAMFFGPIVQGLILLILGYGYSMFIDMDRLVTLHDKLISRIEQRVDLLFSHYDKGITP